MATPECTEDILGYAVCKPSLALCADDWIHAAGHGKPCAWLACLNPHSYAVALQDAPFRAALTGATWLVPDGVGVVFASRLLDGTIATRLTGSDVFLTLTGKLQALGGKRVFLLGSSEATLQLIRNRMAIEFPAVCIAGTCSPPFRESFTASEVDSMIDQINHSQADVLWVAMTAPKQEKWLHAHQHRLNVGFAAAIGAVFDFYAGNVKRSSPIFQRLGFEWLPRLLQEPKRLWRRTLVSAPVFLLHAWRARRSSNRR